jgi:rhamnosyltransferase
MALDRPVPQTREILAVVVCFHPECESVIALSKQLVGTGLCDVLLIDNTESPVESAHLLEAAEPLDIEVLGRGVNGGVAEAHNVGLRIAHHRGYRLGLLLDQDSCLEENALAVLLDSYRRLLGDREERVAAVGPRVVDPRNGFEFPFFRLGRLRMGVVQEHAGEPAECDFLISSGCLIALEAFGDVGEMDEALFIDYVDVEWCTRARARGWKVFGVPAARMQHTIGNRTMRLLGRVIAVHEPERQYYLIRNALLFARKPYLKFKWRVHLVHRATTQLAVFALLCSPRRARLRWLMRGMWDGICGRSGRFEGSATLSSSARVQRKSSATDRATKTVEPQTSQLVK